MTFSELDATLREGFIHSIVLLTTLYIAVVFVENMYLACLGCTTKMITNPS